MYSIPVPRLEKDAVKNKLGLTLANYQGGLSTLCGGCGHDSITAAIIRACFESSIEPHRVAKMSGIGCSSKTPAYFLSKAHGFNAVHGRMPSVVSGAHAAHRDLHYLAVSGDGDTTAIGLGQFMHAMRRGVNMLYILENNGVYGLTKGQFSATADQGVKNKRRILNPHPPIDPVVLALQMGASFVARSFSGDKSQVIPLIQAGLNHKGFALIDVISPCVSFNNHTGSTKSYQYVRDHGHFSWHIEDWIEAEPEILVSYKAGEDLLVNLNDGSSLHLKKIDDSYNPNDRDAAYDFVTSCKRRGEIATGLFYVSDAPSDLHDRNGTSAKPLREMSQEELSLSEEQISNLNRSFR